MKREGGRVDAAKTQAFWSLEKGVSYALYLGACRPSVGNKTGDGVWGIGSSSSMEIRLQYVL